MGASAVNGMLWDASVSLPAAPLSTAAACVELGRALAISGYQFTTVTPETHRRVLARRSTGVSLRDIFGWSLPFALNALPEIIATLALQADILVPQADGMWRSRLRFASLGRDMFAHSAFPTSNQDAVFFGPDTYRFVTLLRGRARPAGLCVDVGCGSGAGGLSLRDRCQQIMLADINPTALQLAAINAQLSRATRVTLRQSDVLQGVDAPFDLVIANPPYIIDTMGRTYRDGGGRHGTDIALRIVRESMARLAPGGQLLLYTGTPICDGEDTFKSAVLPLLNDRAVSVDYGEIDPDVFGEELERDAYRRVERIAVVYLDVTVA